MAIVDCSANNVHHHYPTPTRALLVRIMAIPKGLLSQGELELLGSTQSKRDTSEEKHTCWLLVESEEIEEYVEDECDRAMDTLPCVRVRIVQYALTTDYVHTYTYQYFSMYGSMFYSELRVPYDTTSVHVPVL
jgi:hypothetical protein